MCLGLCILEKWDELIDIVCLGRRENYLKTFTGQHMAWLFAEATVQEIPASWATPVIPAGATAAASSSTPSFQRVPCTAISKLMLRWLMPMSFCRKKMFGSYLLHRTGEIVVRFDQPRHIEGLACKSSQTLP